MVKKWASKERQQLKPQGETQEAMLAKEAKSGPQLSPVEGSKESVHVDMEKGNGTPVGSELTNLGLVVGLVFVELGKGRTLLLNRMLS